MKRKQYVIWHAPTNTFYKGMSWGAGAKRIKIRTDSVIENSMISDSKNRLEYKLQRIFSSQRAVYLNDVSVNPSDFVVRELRYEMVP